MPTSLFAMVVSVSLLSNVVLAHDKHYAAKQPITPQQKDRFEGLKSGKGPCCSDADGNVLSDIDWESKDGRYRVFLQGQWVDVPDDAVLKGPNMYGPTMVWPMYNSSFGGPLIIQIRCFIPGMMT